MKKLIAPLAALSALTATTLIADTASACGGCFHVPSENTVVTGHRMAVSISKTQAVLWDQIEYSGDPSEFSWVLPIKKGAYVEVANDAFFDVLESGTLTSVSAPPEGCAPRDGGGIGCGADSLAPSALEAGASNGRGGNGVEVVNQGTVGPYDTVTLSADNPNALADWLEENGYELPDSIRPTVDAYVTEGFDFIALKLQPGQGVAAMKPVRVVTEGSSYSLPLRMVAAGVGESVDIVLYVIGEGRYEAADFTNATIDPKLVTWDFRDDRSDYALQRLALISAKDGRNFLTTFAQKNAFLGEIPNNVGGFQSFVGFNIGANFAQTMAEAYILQGFDNGEATDADEQTCINNLNRIAGSGVVTDLCDDEGNCTPVAAGQVDSQLLTCGNLDDLAVAMEGMHPNDVVVTRLEAKLPVEALDADLRLEASSDQANVESRFVAGLKVNPCWDAPSSVVPLLDGNKPKHRVPPEGVVLLVLSAAGLSLALRRRRARAGA